VWKGRSFVCCTHLNLLWRRAASFSFKCSVIWIAKGKKEQPSAIGPLVFHFVQGALSSYNLKIITRDRLLGAFKKLRKATISFVVSVCLSARPSVRPHGTTPLHWTNFQEIWCVFKNLSKYSSLIKIGQEIVYFTQTPMQNFVHISLISS